MRKTYILLFVLSFLGYVWAESVPVYVTYYDLTKDKSSINKEINAEYNLIENPQISQNKTKAYYSTLKFNDWIKPEELNHTYIKIIDIKADINSYYRFLYKNWLQLFNATSYRYLITPEALSVGLRPNIYSIFDFIDEDRLKQIYFMDENHIYIIRVIDNINDPINDYFFNRKPLPYTYNGESQEPIIYSNDNNTITTIFRYTNTANVYLLKDTDYLHKCITDFRRR